MTQLARALYNPALLERAACGRAAVVRPALLERLLDSLRRDRGIGAPQHHLLLGPHGSGKTFLLRALGHTLEDEPELADYWLPLTFPEAQYDIAWPSDLWTNCLDYLAIWLQRRGELPAAAELRAAVSELPPDEERRAEESFRLLIDESIALDRRFVLLIDTLDIVIDRLKGDQWRVREILSNEPRLVIIGASARAIEATYRYEAAFYDFFHIHELRPLDADRALRWLPTLSPPAAEIALTELTRTRPGALPAALALLGGQPRILALLGEGLAAGRADPAGLVASVLDQLTPGFQARIDRLAPQPQRVLHALAAAWHPARASDLSARTRLPVNAVSAQLSRLAREGVVEQAPLPPGSRLGYHLSDRLFALWFLLRCGQPHRRRLLDLAGLLERIYEPPRPAAPDHALIRAAADLRQGRWRAASGLVTEGLSGSPSPPDPELWAALMELLRASVTFGDTKPLQSLLDEADPDGRWLLLARALELATSGSQDPLRRTAPELRGALRLLVARITPRA